MRYRLIADPGEAFAGGAADGDGGQAPLDVAAVLLDVQGRQRLDGRPLGRIHVAQRNELTKNVEDIKGPFARWTISPGVYGFDVGKQTTGWATVKIWGATRDAARVRLIA